MSLRAGRIFSGSRPLRSLTALARQHPGPTYSTFPTKNPDPTKPIEPSQEQSMPLGRYYELILERPPPYDEVKPEEPPTSSTDEAEQPPAKTPRGRKPKENKENKDQPSEKKATPPLPSTSTSPPVPTPPPTSAQEQARVVFGSRLAGPAERAERLAEMRTRSRLIAGVLVPPQPDEPDNCCMSGCVNCVWDTYRDEMEEWAMANAEAGKRLQAQEAGISGNAAVPPPTGVSGVGERGSDHHAVSMDDDGGGSETNWDVRTPKDGSKTAGKMAKDMWDEQLYHNIPVGIREFMKTEKMLKERHIREGTPGG